MKVDPRKLECRLHCPERLVRAPSLTNIVAVAAFDKYLKGDQVAPLIVESRYSPYATYGVFARLRSKVIGPRHWQRGIGNPRCERHASTHQKSLSALNVFLRADL
jgi:hypothetical protein